MDICNFQKELVEKNLNLVKHIAYNMIKKLPNDFDINDLISSGVIGLIESSKKFDPTRGVQFQVYSHHRIKGSIIDYLRKIDQLTVHSRRINNKVKQNDCEFKEVNIEEKNAKNLSVLYNSIFVNIDDKINNGLTLSDILPCKKNNAYNKLENKQNIKELMEIINNKLSKIQKKIIILYYFKNINGKKIGEIFGITGSRIHQIRKKSLRILRRWCSKVNYVKGQK